MESPALSQLTARSIRGAGQIVAIRGRARCLLLHFSDRLPQLIAARVPAVTLLGKRERALLHPIEFLEPIHVGHDRAHQILEGVAGQQGAAQFGRQSRSRLRKGRDGQASEDVVQELELEAPADALGHDAEACSRKEGFDIRDEAVETRRATSRAQLGQEIGRDLADHVELDPVFQEHGIGEGEKRTRFSRFTTQWKDPIRMTRRGVSGADAASGRTPAVIPGREDDRARVVQRGAQGAPVLVADGGEQIRRANEAPLERTRLVRVVSQRDALERRSAILAGHQLPEVGFVIMRHVHQDGRPRFGVAPISEAAIQCPSAAIAVEDNGVPTLPKLRVEERPEGPVASIAAAIGSELNAAAAYPRLCPGTSRHSMFGPRSGTARTSPKPRNRTIAPASARDSASLAEYTLAPASRGYGI